jgi:uncharacterized protein
MLIVISPAKRLDFETPVPLRTQTEPAYLDEAAALVEVMRRYRPAALRKLMSVSDELARRNVERYAEWSARPEAGRARQAIFAFKGEVYLGLDPGTLGRRDLDYAQKRLRILSGLYGLLRPYDRILPYRLEMGSAVRTPRGRDLYEYWGETQAEALNAAAAALRTRWLVNLASEEYFKAVDRDALALEVISPSFRDRAGKARDYRVLGFFAKKARGLMARYIIERRCRKPADLLAFDVEGYRHDPARSTPQVPVFVRDHP